MAWGYFAAAAVSIFGSAMERQSASKQNTYQAQVNQYNAQQGYNTDLTNLKMSAFLGAYNAKAVQAAAAVQNRYTQAMTEYNKNVLMHTIAYNDAVLESEIDTVWEAEELDLEILSRARAKERGAIEANQAASGVLMGQDSAADVVMDQQNQEAMDAFIVSRNADKQVAEIENARARSKWEGEMQIQKLVYEGGLEISANSTQARLQAAGIAAESAMSFYAGMQSAESRFTAGLFGAQNQYQANRTQINSNFTTGWTGALSQGLTSYYRSKEPSTKTQQSLLE